MLLFAGACFYLLAFYVDLRLNNQEYEKVEELE